MQWSLEDKAVWRNDEGTRYFLIPDDAQFVPGEFSIRTITGKHRQVEEESLRSFEVSEEEAAAWIKRQFGNFLDGLRGAADDFIAKINRATEKLRSDHPDGKDRTGP